MPTYLSEHVYIGTGAQTDFVFNKGYLSRSHVFVKLSVDAGATFTTKADPADYSWIDSQTIRFAAAPALNAVVWLDRVTPRTIDQTFDNGTVFTDVTQNYGYRQPIYILQELADELDRRPSLDVLQNNIEQSLAQVLGNLAVDGTNLVKSSFDLKATLGRNASGILTVALSKENAATANLAIPGATASRRQGALYISDWDPEVGIGPIAATISGTPVTDWEAREVSVDAGYARTGAERVFDGVFPNWDANVYYAGLSTASQAVVNRYLMLPTALPGQYCLMRGSSSCYVSGTTRRIDFVFGAGLYTVRYTKDPLSLDPIGNYIVDPSYSLHSHLTDAGFVPTPSFQLAMD